MWITRAEVVGAGVEEVDEAGTAVELCKEDGGVGLGLAGLDPAEAGPDGAVVAAAFPEDPAPITAQPHRQFAVWFPVLLFLLLSLLRTAMYEYI